MRETYTSLYIHFVWATWNRHPILVGEKKRVAYAAIHAECAKLKAEVYSLGAIEDHVHLLVRIPPSISISHLINQVKGVSSRLLNDLGPDGDFFKWQGSYAAFSVSENELSVLRNYIQNQEQHHKASTTIPAFEKE